MKTSLTERQMSAMQIRQKMAEKTNPNVKYKINNSEDRQDSKCQLLVQMVILTYWYLKKT